MGRIGHEQKSIPEIPHNPLKDKRLQRITLSANILSLVRPIIRPFFLFPSIIVSLMSAYRPFFLFPSIIDSLMGAYCPFFLFPQSQGTQSLVLNFKVRRGKTSFGIDLACFLSIWHFGEFFI